ncbi:major facilitator superfamily domain-containing protein [Leucosporidium creatinivorum]|uniref:Major facilitator superfamily domain-containing protein n=1 Tax=Leucosporidium creatinivorum TaxID=106004 RepID=A0A1Y2FRV9_9BASI|nr:major facilitator superfamily domain-containing protein [Leucosporidium creatinivorum]
MTSERSPLLASTGATAPRDLRTASGQSSETTTLAGDDVAAGKGEVVSALGLPTRKKVLILAGTFLAVFLSAIDMTITATLVQPIAASFHASHESSWLGTSFLLANITFTPLYGRLCDIIGRRAANASAIFLFTFGTALCAIAPSMKWLIAARFIAGAGGGGIMTTGSIVVSDLFPLKQRGLVGSVSGAIWALGGALGGPLGGFVTDAFGWRAAFIFQVPLLILALLSGLRNINYSAIGARSGETVKQKLRRIDFAGCGLIFIAFGSFLVSLSLRNNEQLPWSNPWVILSTAIAPVFVVAFVVVEAKFAVEPILPLKLLSQRTPFFAMAVTIFVAVCNFGIMYHLPIFFLAIKGATAGEAGAHLLPTSIGNVIGGFIAGFVLHRTGKYYVPSAVAGFGAVLAVLFISQLTSTSSSYHQWFSVFPMGFGFVYMLNSSFIALLAATDNAAVPALTGALWLFRSAGQVVGVASTSAIMQGVLAVTLEQRITGKGSAKIIKLIREDSSKIATLSPELRAAAREAYALALRWVFLFCALFAFLAWLSNLFIPPLSVEEKEPKVTPAPPAEEEA